MLFQICFYSIESNGSLGEGLMVEVLNLNNLNPDDDVTPVHYYSICVLSLFIYR